MLYLLKASRGVQPSVALLQGVWVSVTPFISIISHGELARRHTKLRKVQSSFDTVHLAEKSYQVDGWCFYVSMYAECVIVPAADNAKLCIVHHDY